MHFSSCRPLQDDSKDDEEEEEEVRVDTLTRCHLIKIGTFYRRIGQTRFCCVNFHCY